MKAVRALNVLAVARVDPQPRGFFYNKNLMMLFSRGLTTVPGESKVQEAPKASGAKKGPDPCPVSFSSKNPPFPCQLHSPLPSCLLPALIHYVSPASYLQTASARQLAGQRTGTRHPLHLWELWSEVPLLVEVSLDSFIHM